MNTKPWHGLENPLRKGPMIDAGVEKMAALAAGIDWHVKPRRVTPNTLAKAIEGKGNRKTRRAAASKSRKA